MNCSRMSARLQVAWVVGLGGAVLAPETTFARTCTTEYRRTDKNLTGVKLVLDVTGTNLDIYSPTYSYSWAGGGSRTEINVHNGTYCGDCWAGSIDGLVTTGFNTSGSPSVSEGTHYTPSAGNVGFPSGPDTDINASSGVSADYLFTNSTSPTSDFADIDLYSTLLTSAGSWSWVGSCYDHGEVHGGTGYSCQKSVETFGFRVKKKSGLGASKTVTVKYLFDSAVQANYRDLLYSYANGCTLSTTGTPNTARSQHSVRLTIWAVDAGGATLKKTVVTGIADAKTGYVTYHGVYDDANYEFSQSVNEGLICDATHPYVTHYAAMATPNGACGSYNRNFCNKVDFASAINGVTVDKIYIKREFTALCLHGDISANGAVDLLDRHMIVGLFGVDIGPDGSGNYDEAYDANADLNMDGTIDQDDVDEFDATYCTADTDGSGTLTIFDWTQFNNWFNANDPRADMDADGQFTFFDAQAYNNLYNAGCP